MAELRGRVCRPRRVRAPTRAARAERADARESEPLPQHRAAVVGRLLNLDRGWLLPGWGTGWDESPRSEGVRLMTFQPVKPLGWGPKEKLLSKEMNQLDQDHARSVDGVGGGKYDGPIVLTNTTLGGASTADTTGFLRANHLLLRTQLF